MPEGTEGQAEQEYNADQAQLRQVGAADLRYKLVAVIGIRTSLRMATRPNASKL
jgi:hypothetical protein